MTKEQVIPLIGEERRVRITLNPGNFPGEQPSEYLSEQKTLGKFGRYAIILASAMNGTLLPLILKLTKW